MSCQINGGLYLPVEADFALFEWIALCNGEYVLHSDLWSCVHDDVVVIHKLLVCAT
jgi:hypothetical protein